MNVLLDAGALVAVDRGDLARLVRLGRLAEVAPPMTHPMVLAQVWRRDDGRQAALARFLAAVHVPDVGEAHGRRVGALCGAAGASDVVDAGLVELADDGDVIVTTDPDDLRSLVEACGRRVRVVAL